MKKLLAISFALVFMGTAFSSCKKDFRGVCACKFLSGDKSEYDYSNLTIDEARKKCDTTSQNASNFAGSCSLE
jgi:hypothetical protein